MGSHKSFEELLDEATMNKDELMIKCIENEIIPAVVNRMNHRMYMLVKHHTFNGAKALFAQAMHEVSNWFAKDDYTNKGYTLTYTEPDQHGRVTLKFSMALFNLDRTFNLSSMVGKGMIYNATQDNLFQ